MHASQTVHQDGDFEKKLFVLRFWCTPLSPSGSVLYSVYPSLTLGLSPLLSVPPSHPQAQSSTQCTPLSPSGSVLYSVYPPLTLRLSPLLSAPLSPSGSVLYSVYPPLTLRLSPLLSTPLSPSGSVLYSVYPSLTLGLSPLLSVPLSHPQAQSSPQCTPLSPSGSVLYSVCPSHPQAQSSPQCAPLSPSGSVLYSVYPSLTLRLSPLLSVPPSHPQAQSSTQCAPLTLRLSPLLSTPLSPSGSVLYSVYPPITLRLSPLLCAPLSPSGSVLYSVPPSHPQAQSSNQCTLLSPSGSVLYSTVSAVNGAGSESESVTSTGVVIDTTPPQPIHRFNVGANLVVNPSFEGDGDVAAGVTDGAPSPWTVAGGGRVRVHTGAGAQDGEGYLELVAGEVRQAVGMATAQKYRLTFHVRAVVGSEPGLGYVRLPHARVAFLLPPASPRWHRHIHYFVATAATTDVAVGVLAHRTGFLLDSVDLRPLDEGMRPAPTDPSDPEGRRVQPVRVHVDHRGARSAVVAAWDMVDVETAAVKYRWAIGKVKGEWGEGWGRKGEEGVGEEGWEGGREGREVREGPERNK